MKTEDMREMMEELKAKAEEVRQKNEEALDQLAESVCLFHAQTEEFQVILANEYMTECLTACEKGELDKAVEKAERTLATSKNIEQRLAAHALKELAEKEDKEGIAKILEAGYDFDNNQIKQ